MLRQKNSRSADLLEIDVGDGRLAYALHTHSDPTEGDVLHVFHGVFDERPEGLTNDLEGWSIQFTCLFTLKAAIAAGNVRCLAEVPTPERLRAFPTFRAGIANPKSQKVSQWWLWNGDREWPVKRLSDEQKSLPIRSLLNYPALTQRIRSEWTSDQQPAASFAGDSARGQAQRRGSKMLSGPVNHFLYVDEQRTACALGADLEREGFDVRVQPAPARDSWLLNVSTGDAEDIDSVSRRLEEVAQSPGVEYDGWEAVAG
jgi:hypothetical protein